MDPKTFESALKDCDAVVHTIGTLVDTSVTKGKRAGEEGTYEQMNRDTAKAVGDKLAEFNKG